MLQYSNKTEKNHVSQKPLSIEEPNMHHKAINTIIEGQIITFKFNLKDLFEDFNGIDLSQHELIDLQVNDIIDNEFVSVNAHLVPKLDYE